MKLEHDMVTQTRRSDRFAPASTAEQQEAASSPSAQRGAAQEAERRQGAAATEADGRDARGRLRGGGTTIKLSHGIAKEAARTATSIARSRADGMLCARRPAAGRGPPPTAAAAVAAGPLSRLVTLFWLSFIVP